MINLYFWFLKKLSFCGRFVLFFSFHFGCCPVPSGCLMTSQEEQNKQLKYLQIILRLVSTNYSPAVVWLLLILNFTLSEKTYWLLFPPLRLVKKKIDVPTGSTWWHHSSSVVTQRRLLETLASTIGAAPRAETKWTSRKKQIEKSKRRLAGEGARSEDKGKQVETMGRRRGTLGRNQAPLRRDGALEIKNRCCLRFLLAKIHFPVVRS